MKRFLRPAAGILIVIPLVFLLSRLELTRYVGLAGMKNLMSRVSPYEPLVFVAFCIAAMFLRFPVIFVVAPLCIEGLFPETGGGTFFLAQEPRCATGKQRIANDPAVAILPFHDSTECVPDWRSSSWSYANAGMIVFVKPDTGCGPLCPATTGIMRFRGI